MDKSISKFQDELSKCKNDKHLVLGNGFGRSYDIATKEKRFCWNTLLDLCDFKKDEPIYSLIEECNFDFEMAHQKLNNAIDVIKKYDLGNKLISEFEKQVQEMRVQLVYAVTESHPPSFNSENLERKNQSDQMVRNCHLFLNNFKTVFSLNYDLLLYWVRCYQKPYLGYDCFYNKNGALVFMPDFQYPNDAVKFFFPHGALFIYRNGATATKLKGTETNPILSVVKSDIQQGNFPICISEGTGEQKLKAIKNNSYLLFAYEKIKECKGTIFTFGCSFLEEKENHIIKAILESEAEKIVIGAFNPDDADIQRLKHEFTRVAKKEKLKNKDYIFADTAKGVKLW